MSDFPLCEDCRFFERAKDYADRGSDFGWCRKDTPKLLTVRAEGGELLRDPEKAIWPQVYLTDWCGCGVQR